MPFSCHIKILWSYFAWFLDVALVHCSFTSNLIYRFINLIVKNEVSMTFGMIFFLSITWQIPCQVLLIHDLVSSASSVFFFKQYFLEINKCHETKTKNQSRSHYCYNNLSCIVFQAIVDQNADSCIKAFSLCIISLL